LLHPSGSQWKKIEEKKKITKKTPLALIIWDIDGKFPSMSVAVPVK